MLLRRLMLLLLAGTALLVGACSDGVTIQGCGATFPAPLYKRWYLEYYRLHPEVRTNYQAIGSGAGIRQLSEGLVHFAGTDEALKEARLQEIEGELSKREGAEVKLLQVPMTAGSISLCYNLPDNPQLKLSRDAYLRAILGKIEFWDDDEIKKSNAGVNLPHQKIIFVRRAESSGTTFAFTTHLAAIAKQWGKGGGERKDIADFWDKQIGKAGKSVQWPVGIGGKGNAGVAALIQQTPGALGYIETGYAELTHLPMATLQNKAGKWQAPTMASSRAALKEAEFNKVFGTTIPDPKGEAAYPIVTFTWIVCRRHYADAHIGNKVRDVLLFCLNEGQRPYGPDAVTPLPEALGYVPLPDVPKIEEARKAVQQIQADH